MEEALRAALRANVALAALVAGRVDWGLRSDPLPSVRLLLVSKMPIYTFGGRIGLAPYRVQADCFGTSYGSAKQVARAVDAAIAALTRPAWDACFVLNERDDQEVDAAGSPVHRTALDLRLWHNQ